MEKLEDYTEFGIKDDMTSDKSPINTPDYTDNIEFSGYYEGVPGGNIIYGASQIRKKQYADTTAGIWIGVDSDGIAKINIGDGTNSMDWSGAALAITGSITATTGTIGGWTIGATTITGGTMTLDSTGIIQTAAAGQRVVISSIDNVIHLYDSVAEVIEIGTGAASAIRLTLNSDSTDGIKITSATDATLGMRMDSAGNVTFNGLRIALSNAGAGNDGYGVYVNHAGTAATSFGMDIVKSGAANAIRVTSTSSSDAVEINVDTSDGASALVLNGNDTSRTVPLLDIDDIATSGNAPGIRITSSSTVGLNIVNSDANIGAIDLDIDANSGMNTIGMKMSVVNAGVGTEYAFEFAGSEYNGAITAVATVTGAIKILTSDGAVFIPVYATAT